MLKVEGRKTKYTAGFLHDTNSVEPQNLHKANTALPNLINYVWPAKMGAGLGAESPASEARYKYKLLCLP